MNKKRTFAGIILSILISFAYSQSDVSGDWISTKTLSSVVKLSSYLAYYVVDGLPDNYTFHMKGDNPDFGDAVIVSLDADVVGVGTGVVVTEDGLIMSNAHVTRAYLTPEIGVVKGAGGVPKIGASGKPLKYVLYNVTPEYMFVGMTAKEELDAGNDMQKLAYLARILDDDEDYGRRHRDRALLKIVNSLSLENGNFRVGEYIANTVKIPFSELANPFKTALLDKKVRAVGFPGSGDPNRSSRTSGELMGYESEMFSVLLHTSWISNGNSGGGLFYKDNLIGINTWDNRSTAARPVGKAQPITYWADMFAKYNNLYSYKKVPFDYEWIGDDPSKDSYKNEAYVSFFAVKESNKDVPVTSGKIYVCRSDVSVGNARNYVIASDVFFDGYNLLNLLGTYTVEEVLENTSYPADMVRAFSKLDKIEDMKSLLSEPTKPYFDAWLKGEFYSRVVTVDCDVGSATIPVPRNSKVSVFYIDDSDNLKAAYDLKVGNGFVAGPYTLAIE